MAKKGQKFKKYDLDFKNKVLKEYLSGKSARYLGKKYKMSDSTIETWATKYRKEGTLDQIKKQGRPKKSDIDYKERYEILKKYLAFLEEVDQEKR